MNNKSTIAQCQERLNALFEANHIDPLPHMETRSDLMEWLHDNQRQWAPFMDQVEDILAGMLSTQESKAYLIDVAIEDGRKRKQLTEQLVQALIATGIPVVLDSQAIQKAAHLSHPDLPEAAIDPIPAFTYKGKVFLDPAAIDMDAPLHEYTHLWATALRVANPNEWKNVVALMQETDLWNMVEGQYPKHTQDQVAEEVLATFSGHRGTQRLIELGLSESHGLVAAIRTFWKDICDLFHIHFATAEAVSDRILSDFINEVNPLSLLRAKEEREAYIQLNETRRDNFIGIKGATTMDENNLFSTRMDCLRTAEQMEAKGRTPKEIKIATGWERGVDHFWRYELTPFELKPLSTVKAQWERGFRLEDIIDAPELFTAYPEARHIPVKAQNIRGTVAAFSMVYGITISFDELFYKNRYATYNPSDYIVQKRLKKDLSHELQHYIQCIENFSRGSSNVNLSKSLMIDKERTLSPQERYASILIRELYITNRFKALLLSVKRMEAIKFIMPDIQENRGTQDVQESRKELVDALSKMSDCEFNELGRLAYQQYGKFHRWHLNFMKESDKIYERLAGEVEARNAEKRSFLTASERLRTLGSETMDTPTDDQYLYDHIHRPTPAVPIKPNTATLSPNPEPMLFGGENVASQQPRPTKNRGRVC